MSDRFIFRLAIVFFVLAAAIPLVNLLATISGRQGIDHSFLWMVLVGSCAFLLFAAATVAHTLENGSESGQLIRLGAKALLGLISAVCLERFFFGLTGGEVNWTMLGAGTMSAFFASQVTLGRQHLPIQGQPDLNPLPSTAPADSSAVSPGDLIVINHHGGWRPALVTEQRAGVLRLSTTVTCSPTPPDFHGPIPVLQEMVDAERQTVFVPLEDLERLTPVRIGPLPKGFGFDDFFQNL